MAWEYWLVPTGGAKKFSSEAIGQMKARLRKLDVAHPFDDDTFFIFATHDEKKEDSPDLRDRGSNVFHMYCSIELDEKEVLLRGVNTRAFVSITGPIGEDHLRDFARWALAEWPCELRTGGKVITPEEI